MKRNLLKILCVLGLVVIMVQIESFLEMRSSSLSAQEKSAGKSSAQAPTAQLEQKPGVPAFADIAAIFAKYHCTVCHGGSEPRDGLSLESYEKLMKGGKDGHVLVAGNPAKSKLILRLKGLKEPRMPLGGPPWVSDEEIVGIEKWISAGAQKEQK